MNDYDMQCAIGRMIALLEGQGRKTKTPFLRKAQMELDTSMSKARLVLDLAIEQGYVREERGYNPNRWGVSPIYLVRTSLKFQPPKPEPQPASADGTPVREEEVGDRLVEPPLVRTAAPDGKAVTEVWISVPDTYGRFEVSNLGHLRQLGRRSRSIDRLKMIFGCVFRQLLCDIETSRFGWYVRYDNERHFLDRDKLLALFEGIPVVLDPDEESAARARRTELIAYAQMAKAEGDEA